jgi:hypothetical protein
MTVKALAAFAACLYSHGATAILPPAHMLIPKGGDDLKFLRCVVSFFTQLLRLFNNLLTLIFRLSK